MTTKLAVFRDDNRRKCPFGLNVVKACQTAGDSVIHMEALNNVKQEKKEKQMNANRQVYILNANNTRCIYANKIIESAKKVECDYHEFASGVKDFPYPPNIRPNRLYGGLGAGNQFSAYPANTYESNPNTYEMFSGLASIYSSDGEIHMIKSGNFQPDENLLRLLTNLEDEDI